jgi:phosphoribosylformimino-5-aminoimidazole carboxamide ribotide isomerase
VEVIPAIDLLGGRCVRLYQGDFDKVTSYPTDPADLAASYRDAGARRLHVVDLDGARDGTSANHSVVAAIAAASGLAVQVGGGIRSLDTLLGLLAAGARRAVIGSVAVRDPALACQWLDAAGPDQLVLGLDVRLGPEGEQPEALAHGWREGSGRGLWELAEIFARAGAVHLLCTDIGRDGTLAGPNLRLYAECQQRFPEIGWIASGGVGDAADLESLAATGVAAVVTGKALLDGRIGLQEIRRFSRAE